MQIVLGISVPDVICPVHIGKVMTARAHRVTTGYMEVVCKIMIVIECTEVGCKKWAEYTNGMVIWP